MATTKIPTDLEGVYIARVPTSSPGVFQDIVSFEPDSPYKQYMNDPSITGYASTFEGTGGMQPSVLIDRLRTLGNVPKPAETNAYTGNAVGSDADTAWNNLYDPQRPTAAAETTPETPTSTTPPAPTFGYNPDGSYTLPTASNPITPAAPVTPAPTQPGNTVGGAMNPVPQPTTQTGPSAGLNPPANTQPSLQMPLNGQEIAIDPNTGLPIYIQDPTTGNLIPNPAAGGSGSPGGTVNTGSNPFYPTNTGGPVNTTTSGTFNQAPFPEGIGGNYQQVQNSVQGGQFNTTGQTTSGQAQTSGSAANQTQTGAQNTTQVSTNQSAPVDTLGFGQLLQGAATGAQDTDTNRNAWLQDVMQTGGSGFNSQMEQAIRNSQTGPQLTGAGDSARARMASYGAAEMGRTNLNQRLGAAEQLAGPTALTQLSTAANPYLGKSDTSTGQTLSNSLSNLASSNTGWQNLLSQTNESQGGSTAAQSSQAGAGNIPEGQPVQSSGGCVMCTAAIELGISKHHRVLRKVIDHKLNHDWPRFKRAARGYFAVFTPLARWFLGHPRLARVLWPIAKSVVYEELRIAGRKLPFRLNTWLTHWGIHWGCVAVGHLPVKGYVTDPVILSIARRENIIFNVRA